uniref:Phlebovirus glycoprotein G2 fusion domain-containing protein n=1 Tax=Parascaris equorum TaxID=6256 RepID=A0A914S066_PAREQ
MKRVVYVINKAKGILPQRLCNDDELKFFWSKSMRMALYTERSHTFEICEQLARANKTNKNGQIDSQRCDCIGEQMCLGRACFVKMEIFPGESTAIVQYEERGDLVCSQRLKSSVDAQLQVQKNEMLSELQPSRNLKNVSALLSTERFLNDGVYAQLTQNLPKGCVSDVPGDMEGCQYAGQCINLAIYLHEASVFLAFLKLRRISCDTCRGNYCLIDFDGVEQGCGIGYSRLQSFLRTRNYANWQGHTTCARYQATESTLVHGCVCTNPTGSCNEMNKTRTFQVENVIERRKEDLIYCYSLHHKSKALIGQEVFKNSGTCEGQYCFISLTTSELMVESATFEENYEDHKEFIGISRPRYEILAGCLKVDDDKVSVGCTTEFSRNLSEPLARHCICDSHLCNFYHLLTVDADTRKPIEDSRVKDLT